MEKGFQSRQWRTAGRTLASTAVRTILLVVALCSSAIAQPHSGGTVIHNYEAKVLAEAARLKSEGEMIRSLAVLRQAAVSCANCKQVDMALATAYCELGARSNAAELLRQPVSQVCNGVAVTTQPVRIEPVPSQPGSTTLPETSTPAGGAAPIKVPTAEVLVDRSGQSPATPQVTEQSVADVAAAIAQARQLMGRGNNEAAYQLLLPYEARALGDSSFDYTIGVAALDSGRPGDAVFALQRVVTEQPSFLGARLELGRALYERGDYQHAEYIFTELKSQQPPEAAKEVIDRYLQAIQRQTRHQRRSITGYVEAGIGADSNATAGTDARTVGPFTLDPNARRTASARREFGAGINASLPISARWQALAGASGKIIDFTEAEFVSGNSAAALLGLGYRRQQWRITTLATARHQTFDSEFNHFARHGSVTAERLLGDQWRLRIGYQAGRVEFADELGILDIDQQLLSPGFSFAWAGAGRPAVAFTALLGRDDARQSGSPYGRNIAGARGQYSRGLGNGRLFITGSFLNSNYHGRFGGATSPERRQDAQQFLSLAWVLENWLAEQWRLTPEILLLNNDSTVELFDYERVWAMLTLRRQFD